MNMVKKYIVAVAAMLVAAVSSAQVIQETTAAVGPLTVPAYTMSIDKDVKLVQNAVLQRLKDAKLKTKNTEGYVAVIEQTMPEISTEPLNLYTKVEEVGKKKNRTTVVTICATTTNLTIDQNVMRENLRRYLEAFPEYLVKYEASQNMATEQKNLKQAEKAAASATSALNDIDKSIAADQKKIAEKNAEIARLQEKIKELQKDIKALEANIEKNNSKRTDAERRVNETQSQVEAKQGDVERYRQMSE